MFEINYRAKFFIFAPFFLRTTLNILDFLNHILKYLHEYTIYFELTKNWKPFGINKKKFFTVRNLIQKGNCHSLSHFQPSSGIKVNDDKVHLPFYWYVFQYF